MQWYLLDAWVSLEAPDQIHKTESFGVLCDHFISSALKPQKHMQQQQGRYLGRSLGPTPGLCWTLECLTGYHRFGRIEAAPTKTALLARWYV
jgi:hypothetical protein